MISINVSVKSTALLLRNGTELIATSSKFFSQFWINKASTILNLMEFLKTFNF
jgi:hypothetical protein